MLAMERQCIQQCWQWKGNAFSNAGYGKTIQLFSNAGNGKAMQLFSNAGYGKAMQLFSNAGYGKAMQLFSNAGNGWAQKMPEASDSGSQPCRYPFRGFEMAGNGRKTQTKSMP